MSFKSINNSEILPEQQTLSTSPHQCQRKMTLENLTQAVVTKGLSQYNSQEINDLKNNIICMLEEESQFPFPSSLVSFRNANQKTDDYSFLSHLCPRLLAKPKVSEALQQIENELSKDPNSINLELIEEQLELLRPKFSKTATLDFFCHKIQSFSQQHTEEKIQILINLLAQKWKPELLQLVNLKETSLGFKYTQFSLIQKVITEIAKTDAKNDTWFSPFDIEDYGITDQKSLIEIAMVCAENGSIAKSIHKFGITDQKALIKIAILCAKKEGISAFIKDFGIADQKALIKIAKSVAAQNGTEISCYIQNYGITDPQALIEIAKIAAKQDGGGTSQYISNYGITNQQILIEIAKIAAEQRGGSTSHHIGKYGITNQQALIEIAKIAAKQDGRKTSRYIAKYKISNPQTLIEIAKIAAMQNGGGTSYYIAKYQITNPQALIEIAEIAAMQDGSGTSEHIDAYGITNSQALITIAKIAAAQDGDGTSCYIQNYRITDLQVLIEIAMIAAQTISGPSRHIHNYGITDQGTLCTIASHSAMQNGLDLSLHIKNYGISNSYDLFAIFLQALAQDPKVVDHIENFGFPSRFYPELIKAFVALKEETPDVAKIIRLIEQFAQRRAISIQDLVKDIRGLKTIEGQKITLFWLSHFLGATTHLTPDQFNLLLKNTFTESVLAHRDPAFRYDLTRALISFAMNPTAQHFASGHVLNRPHAQTTLLLTSLLYAQGISEMTCNQVMKAVSDSHFKDTKNVKNLLSVLHLLLRNAVLTAEDKEYLLHQILEQSLESTQEKQEKKINFPKLTQTLLTVPAIFSLGGSQFLNKTNLSLEGCNFGQILHRLFKQVIPLKKRDDFEALYNQHFAEARIPHYIATYTANLQTLKLHKEISLKTLSTCFEQILDGNLQKYRYENHPHINTIFSGKNDLLQKWKEGETCPLNELLNPLPLDFLNTFKQQILIDRHLELDPQIDVLQSFLKEEMTGQEALLAIRQKKDTAKSLNQKEEMLALDIQMYCIKIALEKNPSQSKGVLKVLHKKLEALPHTVEFKKDIDALLEMFEHSNKTYEDWTLIDTDEPQDLFLCGTEAGGSCQNISTNPNLSKCLMAYVLDGKNRLLAVKDPSGRVIARHILRALWNGHQPVLFLERLYPATVAIELEKALEAFALQRAQKLGLPLLSKDVGTGPNAPYSAISLGSLAPFEYCDGVKGETNGTFEINFLKILNI